MGVTDEFLVKFNENVEQSEIDKLHEKYGVEVVKTTDIYQLLRVQNGVDALRIANIYQESGLTRFSHPNFICEEELYQVIPNDTYFANQFSLNNTGQVFTDGHSGTNDADIDAPEAWIMSTGNNDIIIAVLDEGVTSDHPDLPNTRQVRLNGSNFADGDANNPSPTGNHNHGNACAGIIGATQNNSQGISGVAPNCRIMPIRKYNSDGSAITPQGNADAIDFARTNGADIISCSWGYNSDDPNLYPVIRDAIIKATTQGRNNRGCVVVFAAGNNFANNGYVHFPSNVDIAGVLTVGASDRFDLKAFYSPLGDPLSSNNQLIDLVAPSHRAYSNQIAGETFEAWSIDIPGDAGYNSVHETDGGTLPVVGSILPDAGVNNLAYTGRFGGTSYACPQVAGVAALMLSINPNLTQQQVFDILTSNADQVGGYTYTNGRSNELGFGRLNACRAVTEVTLAVAAISGPSTICSSGSAFTLSNLPPIDTIIWETGPYLTVYSGQNTDSTVIKATGTGSSWVQARLVTGCGSVTLPQLTVWAGIPNAPVITSDNVPSYIWTTEYGYPAAKKYTVYMYNDIAFSDENETTYGSLVNNFDWTWHLDDMGNMYQAYDDYGVSGIMYIFEEPGVYRIRAKCSNNCLTTDYSNPVYVEVIDEMYQLVFSPNPAISETTISIKQGSTKGNSLKSASAETTFDENAEWDLEVYDNMQSLKLKKQKLKGSSVTINTQSWKEGVYMVRVKYKDEMLTGKLVVKE